MGRRQRVGQLSQIFHDRYAYDDEKRDALLRWARLVIEGIVGGERQISKVLVFRNA